MPVLDCCFLQLPNISSLLHFYSSLIFYLALLAWLCLLGMIVTLEAAIVWKRLKKKLSGVTPLWRKSFRSSIFPVIVLWHNQDKNTIRDGGGYTLLSLHTVCTFHVNKCSTYMRGHVCPYISIIAYPSWFERMGETTWTGASTCICVIYIPRKLWKFLEHHLFNILKIFFFTVYINSENSIIILLKLLYTAQTVACMPIYCYEVRALL